MIEYKEIINIDVCYENKNERVDTFLNNMLSELTRSYIKKLIDDGNILIDKHSVKKSGYRLKGTEKIVVNIPNDRELEVVAENIPLDIVYEDAHLVIINKDAGVVVHPAQGNYTGTLVNAIMYHIKDLSTINGVIRPGIVHRLDKDTTGLIIIAKNDTTHLKLTDMFKNKEIEKKYICICKGRFKDKTGRIENNIGRDKKDRKKMTVVFRDGKKAITNYKVIDENLDFSLVEIGLETGRTHQIRVHMKSLNHPIVGDKTYGKSSDYPARQMLHAYSLSFIHPITGNRIQVLGDLKDDFKSVAKRLKLDIKKIEGLYGKND